MGVGSKDVKIFILSVLLQKDVYHRFYGWGFACLGAPELVTLCSSLVLAFLIHAAQWPCVHLSCLGLPYSCCNVEALSVTLVCSCTFKTTPAVRWTHLLLHSSKDLDLVSDGLKSRCVGRAVLFWEALEYSLFCFSLFSWRPPSIFQVASIGFLRACHSATLFWPLLPCDFRVPG